MAKSRKPRVAPENRVLAKAARGMKDARDAMIEALVENRSHNVDQPDRFHNFSSPIIASISLLDEAIHQFHLAISARVTASEVAAKMSVAR